VEHCTNTDTSMRYDLLLLEKNATEFRERGIMRRNLAAQLGNCLTIVNIDIDQ